MINILGLCGKLPDIAGGLQQSDELRCGQLVRRVGDLVLSALGLAGAACGQLRQRNLAGVAQGNDAPGIVAGQQIGQRAVKQVCTAR